MRVHTVLTACVILLALHADRCESYNILGVFPTIWKSHYFAGGSLMRSLAADGHNVTVVSPFPSKTPLPNFRDIRVLGVYDAMVAKHGKVNMTAASNPIYAISKFYQICKFIVEYTLDHPAMMELLTDPNEHFDVIIVEVILTDALLGLGQHFNAPVIGFSPLGASLPAAALVGTPVPPSYVPNMVLKFTDRMSFGQRVVNALLSVVDVTAAEIYDSYQAEIYNRAFPRTDKPSYSEVKKNVSLVLLNQHFSTSAPRPYVPNMVEVGGIQINRDERKQLPDDIREFVEGAEHGVIFMSLGTNVLSVDIPEHVRAGILQSFGKRKERILWKWDDNNMAGVPANVLVKNWYPQDDVLGHPNVKLFITHGGLLSLSETVYHGLPIVGIPFFGDQMMNMAKVVTQGYGVQVVFKNLTETSLSWALDEVLDNPTYSNKARELSARYRDQPMRPMDLAKYWVEYVARHKGAPHIQSAGLRLNFWQYHSLDVFAVLLGVVIVWIVFVYFAIYWLCCRRKTVTVTAKNTKKTKKQ